MSAEDEDLGPELDFLRELWALDHSLQKASKRMDRELGMTGPQRLALRLVARFPGLPAGALAQLMHLHPSTVSGIVRRLAARGLLDRGASSADRRRAALRLTVQGLTALGRSYPTIELVVGSVLEEQPAAQRKAALAFLRALAARLDDSRAPS